MKVWNYSIVLIGLVVLFNVLGIDVGTEGIETLINMANGSIDFTVSNFFNALFSDDLGALVSGLGATIILGFVLSGRLENFIILPFITGVLVVLAQVFMTIIQTGEGTQNPLISGILMVLLAPLTIGYFIALVEFFRGSD